MVSPEQAKAYLASLARADWRERRLVAAEQLGGAVRLAAVAVLAPAQTGDVPVAEREELARTTLAELDDQQRATLWLLLFPRMTEAVERAWQLVARPGFGAALGTPTWRLADDGWLLRERRLNLVRWLAQVLGPYDPTLAWVAEWSAHLGATDTGSRAVGTLLAAALEAGDEAVLAILAGSADGTALVGAIGYHLVRGLLYCSRPEAWLVVERLLLSAGLEDGLRAHILSVMREGHPAAFARLVGTLAEHGLARFPAVRQGISRWLGYGVDDLPVGDAEQALSALRVYLTDPAAREAAVTRDDAVALHRAL